MRLAFLTGCLVVVTVVLINAQSSSPGRVIERGKPIESQLISGEPLVIVRGTGTVTQKQTVMSIDDRIAQMAACDNAAVLHNVEGAPHLSDRGRWIQTELHGHVSEIVKRSDPSVRQDGEISFIVDGGELTLRRTTVRAGRVPLWNRDRS
jgi:hypothetical protein